MGADIDSNDLTMGKHLVCYFEDGSYSIVSELELLPFCPSEQPYLSYLDYSDFLHDKAVMLANRYWEYGNIPETFKWLHALYSTSGRRKTFNSAKKSSLSSNRIVINDSINKSSALY